MTTGEQAVHCGVPTLNLASSSTRRGLACWNSAFIFASVTSTRCSSTFLSSSSTHPCSTARGETRARSRRSPT